MKKLLIALFTALCLGSTAQAGMISLEKEIEMGRETGRQLEQQYGVLQDKYQQDRINRIGQRLAKVCGREEITNWKFTILNNKEINALACPGGFIYVFKGLVDYMPSDTEIAGVLGHEVGHVAKKHTVHSIEKNMWGSLGAVILGVASGSAAGMQASMVGMQALQSGFSRTDERGADKEGVINTISAGFNPYAMLITANKLEDLTKSQPTPSYGLFSSHPEPEERIKRVSQQIGKLKLTPTVTEITDWSAAVNEGNKWSHTIHVGIGNTKALYRAYMLAGSMWQIKQSGYIYPEQFYIINNGSKATVYYGNIEVLTCYNQDGAGGAGKYANDLISKLRNWAQMVNSGAIPISKVDKYELNPDSKKKDKKKKKK